MLGKLKNPSKVSIQSFHVHGNMTSRLHFGKFQVAETIPLKCLQLFLIAIVLATKTSASVG